MGIFIFSDVFNIHFKIVLLLNILNWQHFKICRMQYYKVYRPLSKCGGFC